MKRLAVLLLLASCTKQPFIPQPVELVESITKCDSWGRCRVTSSLGRTALMHSPSIDQKICSFMKSTHKELSDYFFACEKTF